MLASPRALPMPLFTSQYICSNCVLSSIRFKGNLYIDVSQIDISISWGPVYQISHITILPGVSTLLKINMLKIELFLFLPSFITPLNMFLI